jgi:hypothetical protein
MTRINGEGDARDVVKALDLINRKTRPVAMCPRCRTEPLVFTFDRPKYEFTCVHCGGWFGFLDPIAAEDTPELQEQVERNKQTYEAIKKANGA